jgi:hypothetical protein
MTAGLGCANEALSLDKNLTTKLSNPDSILVRFLKNQIE